MLLLVTSNCFSVSTQDETVPRVKHSHSRTPLDPTCFSVTTAAFRSRRHCLVGARPIEVNGSSVYCCKGSETEKCLSYRCYAFNLPHLLGHDDPAFRYELLNPYLSRTARSNFCYFGRLDYLFIYFSRSKIDKHINNGHKSALRFSLDVLDP